jgi:apolipoprotein N-acyltransferase
MALAYALWHGLRFGVFFALAEPARRAVATRLPALAPIVVAVLYMVIEWGWPVIFPWALAHGVWELPGASALLALQGVPLLTFMVALVNAMIAEAWSIRRFARPVAVPAATFAAILAVATIVAPAPSDETLRVAIVQPGYSLAEKKHADLAMRKRLLERIDGLIRSIPPDTVDLVVASEGAFPLWWRLDADDPNATKNTSLDATRRIQRAIVEGPRAHVIMGGLRQDDARRTRNSAVHLGPDGRLLGHYDKQTLVPFSEYVPFGDLIPALADIPGIGDLQPGDAPCAFEVPFVGKRSGPVFIACGICYETMFAAGTRADAGRAEVLVNLTIDTWFGTSTAPRMHLATHASRAAELGVPLIRSALTGITAALDHRGQLTASLPMQSPGVVTTTITLGGPTVFRAIGQWFAPLGALLCLAVLVDAFMRRKALV